MPKEILKKYFGYDEFRDGQAKIIDKILNGTDVLGIMPTGAGKSLCFQVPAVMNDGITLVISPLISLMQDQVKGLIQAGISCAYINSSLTTKQINMALYNAKMGKYKIIYVAPERLLTDNFLDFAQSVKISMLTVDEAHCISQWGQDFRPSYAQIPEFIENLSVRPVVSAFTATATEKVKEDIVKILRLNNPYTLVTGFDRKNLYFEVINSSDKFSDLVDFLHSHKQESGIVYCSTRKNVEQVCDKLQDLGYNAEKYHAGIDNEIRKISQHKFIFDEVKIMVATNAFGMGIDKSNVKFVVHYNMPKDMESYYQEAGRAGRDGTNAHCLMLYSGQDVITNQFLIDNSRDVSYEDEETERILKERAYKRLKDITFYATINSCLRNYILNYFGEKSPSICENCSNCDTEFQTLDATVLAQKIISCVTRIRERFGKVMIIDILKGAKTKKILEMNFDKLSVYSICDESIYYIRTVLNELIVRGYLNQTDSEFAVITLTPMSSEILKGTTEFVVKIPVEQQVNKKQPNKNKEIPIDKEDLFEKLRLIRANLAKKQSVPPFVIFNDASLIDMCKKLPTDKNSFLKVSGVGQLKLEKYGDEFINAIKSYCEDEKITPNTSEEITKKKKVKPNYYETLPSLEMISEIEITEEKISVSILTANINNMADYYSCKRTSSIKVSNWLMSMGYLEIEENENGKIKVPTSKGLKNGIIQEERTSEEKTYKVNLYPQNMQEFIIENLYEILKL
ncbi:MAG: DNA helicase RecQ [Clostridia bacterium]